MKNKKEYPAVFGELTVFRSFQKDEIILQAGKTENYVSFVLEGAAGLFFKKGIEDICCGFVFNDQYLSVYDSFCLRIPSQMYTLALEDTVLASISFPNLQMIYQNTPDGERFGRMIAEQLLFKTQHRLFSFLSQSAEERYLSLLMQKPEVLLKIKQKYIASYLGITPVSLSRLRNKIARQRFS